MTCLNMYIDIRLRVKYRPIIFHLLKFDGVESVRLKVFIESAGKSPPAVSRTDPPNFQPTTINNGRKAPHTDSFPTQESKLSWQLHTHLIIPLRTFDVVPFACSTHRKAGWGRKSQVRGIQHSCAPTVAKQTQHIDRSHVFFDIEIDHQNEGRVIFELVCV